MNISKNCGYVECDHFSPGQKAQCDTYDDRRNCPVSMKRRAKQADHSRRYPGKRW